MVESEKDRYGQVEFACSFALPLAQIAPTQRPVYAHVLPKGPVTVNVLFGVCLYVVRSCLTHGSPIESSTPGGIEIGVRPSFDDRVAVAENCRRPCCAGAASAGTRNEGNVMTEDGESIVAVALVLLGASILA